MTTFESHTHSAQYSTDGESWTSFTSYVESFTTHHGYQADRGTAAISCYVYPAGLAENDYVVLSIDSVMVFNGRMARPGLHYAGNSCVIECEGRGAYLAKNWKGDGVDPELDELFNRVYESQTDGAIITNLCEAAGVEISMHDIEDSGVTRGTLYPITLRTGQPFWSLIRGDTGLDEPVGYWTAETNNGAVTRRPIAVDPDTWYAADEGDNIIAADRTPQGTESIINRCIYYGFEYEGGAIGGIGVGDYSLPNDNIDGFNPRIFRTNIVETDADALASATSFVTRHNFPYDETNITMLGQPYITVGNTINITSALLDHAGGPGSLRFIAEVSHRYGAGVGFETAIKCIRTE
jgi:hypothetical protein